MSCALQDQTTKSAGTLRGPNKHYHGATTVHGKNGLAQYLANKRLVPYPAEKLARLVKNHSPLLYRINQMKKLPVHDGCVNTICWNKTGEYILSGSDDRNLCITRPSCLFDYSKDYTVLHKIQTHHLGNIFCAQFIPESSDRKLVSCSSDGPVIVHDINSTDPSQGIFIFNCHSSTIYDVVTLPDQPNVFLSGSEDKSVRLFDMRCHKSCSMAGTCPHPPLIKNSHPITTLAAHPLNSNLLLLGRADGMGLLYDRRKLPDPRSFSRERAHAERLAGQPPSFEYMHPLHGVVAQFSAEDLDRRCRFTSLCFSQDGSQILASYSQDYIYLFNHDKSSNLELIQTLPKKVKVANQTGDSADSNEANGSNDANESASTRRLPRIRFRGNWTDTGVNSVPSLSAQVSEGDSSRPNTTRSEILLRFNNAITSRITSESSNDPWAAIFSVGGVSRRRGVRGSGSSNNNTSDNSTPNESHERNQDASGKSSSPGTRSSDLDMDEDDDDDDDDDEHDDGDDDDDEDEDEDDDDDDDTLDDDENDDSDDDDDRSDNVDEDFEERESGEEGSEDELDSRIRFAFRSNADSEDQTSSSDQQEPPTNTSGSSKVSKVSPQTRLKFKKTVDRLRNQFSQIPSFKPHVKYQGHRNSRTSIKQAVFWGDKYIMSGSDCGRIMVWEKDSAKIVMAFAADERVVNCLAPNPHSYALASSGIDYDIKLWSTQSINEDPLKISQDEMDYIVMNNELMLEEAKKTMTVPPHWFFRVLASYAASTSLNS